jgi:hypothetical protein
VPKVAFRHVVQRGETDLAFLRRLAEAYGCALAVKDRTIGFTPLVDLLNMEVVATLRESDVSHYTLRSKTSEQHHAAVVRFFDPGTKARIAQLAKPLAPLIATNPRTPGEKGLVGRTWSPQRVDVLKLYGRVENEAQAKARIDAAMLKAKMGQVEGTMTIPGDPRLRAGMKVALEGFGVLDTEYLINKVRHRFDREGGYTAELDLSINPIQASGKVNG